MTDRREALSNVSAKLRELIPVLQALAKSSDHSLPLGMRFLLDAIDHVDVAAGADRPISPGPWIAIAEGRALAADRSASAEDLAA
jgi:hypothetical protein